MHILLFSEHIYFHGAGLHFKVGDQVECRDESGTNTENDWTFGTVASISPLTVKLDDHAASCKWDDVRYRASESTCAEPGR